MPITSLERQVFECDHVSAAAVIVNNWGLPELLALPITTHHRRSQAQPSLDEKVQLCQIGYFVGTLPLNNPDKITAEDMALLDFCATAFALKPAQLDTILGQTQEEFHKVAEIFDAILPEKVDIAELVIQAHDLLADVAAKMPREIFELEKEVSKLRMRCATLDQDVSLYRRQAETDDLTGLLHREPLLYFLNDATRQVQAKQSSLAVFFIDIDNFKKINTYYGHAVADDLLRQWAGKLRESFPAPACLCRYGGDELVVALPGIAAKAAIGLAAGLNSQARSIALPPPMSKDLPEDAPRVFTCSIGLLYCDAGAACGDMNRVLELADNQMYRIKRHGKDGFSYDIIAQTGKHLKI